MISKKKRVLLLFSGGLDSILAYKILKKAKFKITLINFYSIFFSNKQAKEYAKILKAPLICKDLSSKYLSILLNPLFGCGKNLNPCIDCHSSMLAQAEIIRKKKKYDFLATGEVLGQRPFSQNKIALKKIEQFLQFKKPILRPLSAKKIKETTKIFKESFINNYFYAISGKSRKKQIELVRKFKIKKYPSPAGGCILTDKIFSQKIKKLIKYKNNITLNDLKIIRLGRLIINNKGIIILGRNEKENILLTKMTIKNDYLLQFKNIPGATALIRPINNNIAYLFKIAQKNIIKYSKKTKNIKPNFLIKNY